MDFPKMPPFPPVTGAEVQALRSLLGLSQPEFAERFHLELSSLRGWEQGKRMSTAASVLFRLIAFNPDAAASVLQDSAERRLKAMQRQPNQSTSTEP